MSPHRKPPKAAKPRFVANLEQLEARDNPSVVAIDNYYLANRGETVFIPANRGVLANDFSTIDFGAVLTASIVPSPESVEGVNYVDFDATGDGLGDILANPVPAGTVTLNPDGSLKLVIPSNAPTNVLGLIFSYQASNASNPLDPPATGRVIVYIGRPAAPRFAVGAEAGAPPVVHVYDNTTGLLVQTLEAYDPSFTGGVRVAVADFNADGVPDVATAPGPGGSPHIKIFDGRTGRLLFNAIVFDPEFRGGAHVAAGDVNGDGFIDLIVGAGIGGGPRVLAINGQGLVPLEPGGDPFSVGPRLNPVTNVIDVFDPLMDFFAYEDAFRGGVRVAAGDLTGEGYARIVTAPGGGGGPVVKTFDFFTVVGPPSVIFDPTNPSNGKSIRQPLNNFGINANGSAEPSLSFYAGDDRSRTGVNVGTADTDGDGRAEIITGPANGPAVVKVFNGLSGGLLSQFGVLYEQIPTVNGGPTGGLLGNIPNPSGILLGPNGAPDSLLPYQRPGGTSGLSDISSNIPPLALGGITVTGGDFDGDGKQEIIVGAGRGNAPKVRVFRADGTQVADFLAFPATVLTGVNVG